MRVRTSHFFAIFLICLLLSGCEKYSQGPAFIILTPTEKDEFDIGNEIEVSIDAYDPDNNVAEVKFFIDNTDVSKSNSISYSYKWNTTYEEEGTHTIKVTVKDKRGRSSSDELEVLLIQGVIPNVEVDIFRHLYSPPIIDLKTGGSMVIEGGHSGIIIYRDSTFHFMAFDRTCTLWPDHTAAVVHDTIFANDAFVCPVCNSQFLHRNEGEVIRGPAQNPLVRYKAVVNSNTLHIYN